MVRLAVALLILSAGTAFAQSAPVDPARPEVDKQICRVEPSTGSIISTRICHTRAQWAAIAEERERARDSHRHAVTVDFDQGRGGVIPQ